MQPVNLLYINLYKEINKIKFLGAGLRFWNMKPPAPPPPSPTSMKDAIFKLEERA